MKTQTKIALILFISNVAIVLLFGGVIYYSQNKFSYNDFYKRLETRAGIAARYRFDTDRLSTESLKSLRNQHLERLSNEREYIVKYPVEEKSLVNVIPVKYLEEIAANGKAFFKTGNTFFAGLKFVEGSSVYLVIVSAENYYTSHHLSFLRNIIVGGVVLMIVVTVCFSVYFSRRIFNPIRQITHEVKQISTENMHLRLQEKEQKSEIAELILTFNDLLNRLETAFETQKNFISNASHEFGTPLTTIIGEADLALIKERNPSEYREALQNVLFQAERLDKITKSLLFLAQTGYSANKIALNVLRMDEIVWSAKQVMDNLNPQNQIVLDLSLLPDDSKKLKVKGNKDLLQMAIANVLNNACKYSQNKPVTVSVAAGRNQVIVVIKDHGIGIPENEMPYIYDPFFRASNTTFFEGYGIGLPLTRNIIKLHGGSLIITSRVNEGTTVQISLPLQIVK
jgi:signal transduction histidine kinase